MQTRLTQLLGIRYPIVCGGMQRIGTADLASAVSNAGALGVITALSFPTPAALAEEIARCKKLTSAPFAVNITFLPSINPPPYEEYVRVVLDSGVKIVETAGNNPKQFMPLFKAAGVKVIHKCTSLRHSITAEKLGVDAVSIDGFECAGHPGEDDVGLFVLLPRVARALKIPVIASGGIGDGRGLAAALVLGAEGINMGTRFLCTKEAPAHDNVKNAIVKADELSTVHLFRTLHNTARVFKNGLARQVVEIEKRSGGKTDFNQLAPLVSGKRATGVYDGGDIEAGIWTAGQVMGLIDDVPTCNELVQRIVAEAKQALAEHASRFAKL